MSALKAKIRAAMMEHLQGKGYPNMTSVQVLAELKPMWLLLREKDLIMPQWKFETYVSVAHAKAHLQNLREAMHEEMMRRMARKRR